MKKIQFNFLTVTALLLFCAVGMQAQKSKVGTWKSYMAYQNAILVAETPNRVFAVYKGMYNDGKEHDDGSLFSYSLEDREIKTYSFEDGLNDVRIVQLAYAPIVKALIIVYENSNIDLFYGKNNVFNVSSIKDNIKYPNKSINSINIIGKYAYLAANFGVAVLDLERREIQIEYRLDVNTTALCQIGDYFFVSTSDGLKKAPVSTVNLIDKENWQKVELQYEGNTKAIEKMVVFKEQLVFYDSSKNKVYYLTKDGAVKQLYNGWCRQLTMLNDQLVLSTNDATYFYTDLGAQGTKINITSNSISSYNSENTYWIAQPVANHVDPALTGLIEVKKEKNSSEYTIATAGIKVNSPLRNYCFFMTYESDKLLVTGGSRLADRMNIEGTFMIYENGKWLSVDDKILPQKTGTRWCRDFISATVDPRDPHRYFVGGWGEGLFEFRDTTFVNLHSYKNTNNALQTANPNYYPESYVRIEGLAYDKNNNLYVLNQLASNGIGILTADNRWIPVSYPPVSNAHPGKILIDRNNQKWITFLRLTTGVMVFDDNNTIENTNDDTYYFSNRFVDQQGADIKAINYLCIAEDKNGVIWVGTDNGPISFSSAAQVGRGECNRVISTDQYGSGYRLLEGIRINAIAVDGANRKWMGSDNSGVFVVDNSGENLKVENFTTSNSSLISNSISSIAINNKTGEVFIGTNLGIVSYMNEAIEGSSDYSGIHAYPNPVKPSRDSQVIITGMMANSTVKITDMAGNMMNQGISLGGQYSWNCANRAGETVKSGIYLVFATLPDGSQGVVTKIMVIK